MDCLGEKTKKKSTQKFNVRFMRKYGKFLLSSSIFFLKFSTIHMYYSYNLKLNKNAIWLNHIIGLHSHQLVNNESVVYYAVKITWQIEGGESTSSLTPKPLPSTGS